MAYRKIRRERLKKGWTQEYVGKCVGLSKVSIHSIEIGEQNPSYDVLVSLEKLFRKTHNELLTPDTEPLPQLQGKKRLNLIAARTKANLTQTQLGKIVGLSKQQVSNLEIAISGTPAETWDRLEDVLGVPQRQLREVTEVQQV